MQNTEKLTMRQWTVTLILSYCSALALSMKFAVPELSAEQQTNVLTEIVWNLRSSLSYTSTISTLCFVALVCLGVLVHQMKERAKCSPRLLLPVSFLIALVWLMGTGFRINDTLEALCASPGQIVKSVCYVVGSTYLLHQLGQWFFCFLERETPERIEKRGNLTKLAGLYDRHPFRVAFYAILVCWLPYLIICYPGYICSDAWFQLAQFFGIRTFTAHHPPMHTLFLAGFVQLGLKMGSGNAGLYLSVITQSLIEAAVFAYTLYLMSRWKTSRWLQIGSFCIIVVVPYYTGYMCTALKDNLYSVFFVLFVEESICILEEKQGYFLSLRHKFLLAVSILGTLLFRNNGQYVLYPTIVLLLVYIGMTWGKKVSKKCLVKMVAGFLVPIVLANGLIMTITAHYGIQKGSIREALSLPFQQTARYVLERGNEVTEEEAEVIRAVLDYDNLAENYNPKISDPVKATYKEEATAEDLLNYLSVWFRQFLKHPGIYITATMNQNYYLLYPFSEHAQVYDSVVVNSSWEEAVNELLDIHEIEYLSEAKIAMGGFYRALFSLPVVGQLSHPASYNLLLIALLVFAIYKKKWKWLMVSIPVILSNVVIVFAPTIQSCPRYAFPIIYVMPIMFAYYIRAEKLSA